MMNAKILAVLACLISCEAFLSPFTPVKPASVRLCSSSCHHKRGTTSHRHSTTRLRDTSSSDLSHDETGENNDEEKPATVFAATFGLMKAILGSGCLALPSGLAAMSDYPSMLWPANILVLTLGVLSAYTFSLYGRLAHRTQAKNLSEMWQQVFQKKDARMVSLATFIFCFGCSITYSLVIGDMMSSLIKSTGVTNPWLASRQTSILAVTAMVLWPLCNLSSLAALAPVSIVGVLGTMVATLFVTLRCPVVLPSSPYSMPGGMYVNKLPISLQPQFGTYNRLASPSPLVLISMASVAWMAHFTAPDFYHSLVSKKKGVSDTSALKKYNIMTIAGYAVVAIINAMMLSFGFLTFGGHSKGIVLNNYATVDFGAKLSRALVVTSVMGGFPFVFGGFRTAFLDLFGKKSKVGSEKGPDKKVTALLLSVITAIALVIKDAGFVVSFNGALMGTAIIYIFPAMLFLKLTNTKQWERWFCKVLIGFGAVSAVVGAFTAVLNSYFPHLLM